MYSPSASASRLSSRALIALLGEWDNGPSTYQALADRIQLMAIDGRIATGSRLPSERELAAHLGRSRATIVAAYQALREAGYAASVRGSGTSVTLPHLSGRADLSPRPLDFAQAIPPPIDGLQELMAEVAPDWMQALHGSGPDLLGSQALREAIANRYTLRGVETSPSQIMVTMGGQHAIALVARTLLRQADHVLVESPSYPHAFDALRQTGARLTTTPVDRRGWDLDDLTGALHRIRPSLAYLIPDFHNPTAASMPAEDRARVVDAVGRAGTFLVIDETTADLNIDRGWDDGAFVKHAHGKAAAAVITIGSLSKSVWSGLRIGWIRADPQIIGRLLRARPSGDLGTPQLEQLIGRQVVERLDELLPRRIAQIREGRDLLRSYVREALPRWDVPDVEGGLSLWVGLDRPQSSALALRCLAQGLTLGAGPRFTVDGSLERFVRLPYTTPAAELRAGIDVIAACWNDLPAGDAWAEERRLPSIV